MNEDVCKMIYGSVQLNYGTIQLNYDGFPQIEAGRSPVGGGARPILEDYKMNGGGQSLDQGAVKMDSCPLQLIYDSDNLNDGSCFLKHGCL